MMHFVIVFFFFFKQKTAYELRISDWSSDVCSSDLMRTSMGVAHSLGLGKTDIAAAGRGIEDAARATRYFRAPPADPVVFTLDAPLTLEPEVDSLLAADRKRWVGFPPDMDMAEIGMAEMDMAETDRAETETAEAYDAEPEDAPPPADQKRVM